MKRTSLVMLAAIAFASNTASAERLVGLVGGNGLTVFESTAPGAIGQVRSVTGLGGQTLLGIDVRPANGLLYGLGSGGGIFSIDLSRGGAAASLRSTISGATLDGTAFGIDFNPVPDRLRIVSNNGQNLRVNVDSGAALVDGRLTYAGGDANAGTAPSLTAAAYTNSFAPSPRAMPGTQLYYIDTSLFTLATTSAPNAGVVNTIGSAGRPTVPTGFDISGTTGIAYASWLRGASGNTGLFTLNLSTGAPTLLGNIGFTGLDLRDLALAPVATPAPAVMALFGLGAAALIRRRA
ncbi:MAG: DUF4394 domain-containing protein [Sphingomonadaceae bacterium]|nr:DUF4394 domain-containing protein [Sphingomonadaceae bacterium]